MIEHEYLIELIRQFKKAYGIEKFDINDEGCQRELIHYTNEMKAHRGEYIRLLHTLNVYTDEAKTIEVGKGPEDSVVTDTNATIVTPYIGLFEPRSGKTYEGSSIIYSGDIFMQYGDVLEELDIEPGRVYITHNMYHYKNTNEWYKLVEGNDIVIGAYGRVADRDRESKIKKIEKRFDEIGPAYVNHGVVGDFYYFAMKSKPKKIEKVKVKQRELEYGRVR